MNKKIEEKEIVVIKRKAKRVVGMRREKRELRMRMNKDRKER
jgi:hypothetical protein